MRKILVLFLLISASAVAQVTCRAVAPGGSGTGLSWSSPLGPSAIGSAMIRGARYYLADGSYGSQFNFTTAVSGTTIIEVRKAQTYDFGRSTDGCSNDISAGWVPATMGSAQAFVQGPSGGGSALFNISGYYVINGNGAGVSADPVGCGGMYATPTTTNVVAPTSPAGCGIRIDDSTCTATALQSCGEDGNGVNRTNGNNVTVEYVEMFGNGGRGSSLATVGGTFPNENYWWWVQTPTNTTITHNYYHNMMTTYFLSVGGISNVTIDHNYFWGLYDQSSLHSEAIQLEGSNTGGLDVHDNIFRDQTTNGDIVQVIGGSTTTNVKFYNNLDFCTNGTSSADALYGTTCNHTQGMFSCINSPNTCTGWLVYNNTMAQVGGGSGSGTFRCGVGGDSPESADTFGLNFENNLFYNCGAFLATQGNQAGSTWDYNAYLNSGRAVIGAHDTSSSSSPNPFVALNATSPNLAIAVENALWTGRLSLGSPYDTDILGNARTSDRGAYQFQSGGASFNVTPSTVPAHHSNAITLTIAGSGLTSSATFTIAGVTGAILSSCTNTATSGSCHLVTGSGTGVATITDTTDSVSTTITIAAATLAIAPSAGNTGTTPTLTMTGTNTLWLSETAAGLFTVSGGTGSSIGTPTVTSNTAATVVLTTGSVTATETITDTSTTATAAFTVAAPTLPTVTTGTAGSITSTTANIAGNSVACTGACSTVTSEGTCYALTANPTAPCTSDGTGTPFFSSLTGLTAATTYHFRAFAVNAVGTAYGSDQTFTTAAIGILYLTTSSCSTAVTETGASATWTASCTPTAANDAITMFVQCHPTSGTITGITLTAPGWTINQLVPPASTGSNSWGALFGAIAPNTSAATFTATFTGGSNCTNFAIFLGAEFSGNDQTGSTTTFNATGSASGSGSTCNQAGAAVTPPLNNEAVWFACLLGSATSATAPWTLGANDGVGNSAEYQILTGGAGVAQTPAYNGSAGAYVVEGVAIAKSSPQTLTVIVNGTGSITSSPGGITCPGTCSASFSPGTPVTLTTSGKFSAWTGACAGQTSTCTITITSSISTTGLFGGCAPPGYCAYTGTDIVQPSSTPPNFGTYTNNGAVAYDTSFTSHGLAAQYQSRIARCTDQNFTPTNGLAGFAAGLGGAGSGIEWNTNSTLIHVLQNTGSSIIAQFNPTTMVCSPGITKDKDLTNPGSPTTLGTFGFGEFSQSDPTIWWGNIGVDVTNTHAVTPIMFNTTTGFYSFGSIAADFSLGLPVGANVSEWQANTAYVAGTYVKHTLTGGDVKTWSATTAFNQGDLVYPGAPNCGFIAKTAGTSGGTQPTWPVVGGVCGQNPTTVTDGTVVWKSLVSAPPAFVYQLTSVGGTSGGSTPAFVPVSTGHPDLLTTVTDGSLTWTNVGVNVLIPNGLWTSLARVSPDGTKFSESFSTDTYGADPSSLVSSGSGINYGNANGDQGTGLTSVSYDATANIYHLFNTLTAWQTDWVCTGGTGSNCSGGTFVQTPQGVATGQSCPFLLHSSSSSAGIDYLTLGVSSGFIGSSCPATSTPQIWRAIQPFNASTQIKPQLATLTHEAYGFSHVAGVGQNSLFYGFTTGAYSNIFNLVSPGTVPVNSWQAFPCDVSWFRGDSTQPCQLQTDQHLSWAFNPNRADNTPACGTFFEVAGATAHSANPGAAYQGEVVCFSTTPTQTSTGSAQFGTQWRFAHTWSFQTNSNFNVWFNIGQLSQDGRFYAYGTDWVGQFGSTTGVAPTLPISNPSVLCLCGFPRLASTAYTAGTVVVPIPSLNGGGSPFDAYQAMTSGTTGSATPNWASTVVGGQITDGGVTWQDLGNGNGRGEVIIVELSPSSVGNVVLAPVNPVLMSLFKRGRQ